MFLTQKCHAFPPEINVITGNSSPNIPHHEPLQNTSGGFLKDDSHITLFSANKNIFHIPDHSIQLTGYLYVFQKRLFLTSIVPTLEYNKKTETSGLGAKGSINMPLFKKKHWSIRLDGKVNSSPLFVTPQYKLTSWNIEYQVGCYARYNITNFLMMSLGAYQYRIMNFYQYENPARAFIKSHGGFLKVKYQF